MVLGDSITSGIGIAKEDYCTNILERKLRELYCSCQIEAINVAVQGFETLQEEKHAPHVRGHRSRPDGHRVLCQRSKH